MKHTPGPLAIIGRRALHAMFRLSGAPRYLPPLGLKIDLGCGAAKKAGFIGIDAVPGPGVDHVVDVEREPLPFVNDSVGHVFSSHCVEHLSALTRVFKELTRVACDGGLLEIWTPFVWHSDMWLPGHVTPMSSELYLHMGHRYRDIWAREFGASWRLLELTVVTRRSTIASLALRGIGPAFAFRHLHDVFYEVGALIRVEKTATTQGTPRGYWGFDRDPQARLPLLSWPTH